jgi:hypothetical protein
VNNTRYPDLDDVAPFFAQNFWHRYTHSVVSSTGFIAGSFAGGKHASDDEESNKTTPCMQLFENALSELECVLFLKRSFVEAVAVSLACFRPSKSFLLLIVGRADLPQVESPFAEDGIPRITGKQARRRICIAGNNIFRGMIYGSQ